MATKKIEMFKALDGKEILKTVSLLCDVLPEEKLEDLYAILLKALTVETTRHYITKRESELKKCLTATQAKKFNDLVRTLVKTKID